MSSEKPGDTRYLGKQPDATPMPPRPTGPMDHLVPWVIEFRVIGTPHMIQVPANESIIIGRGDPRRSNVPDVDLTPYAAHVLGVSRQHARISVQKDRVLIQDLNSANGTYLNGHLLAPGQEYRLRHSDQISFGQLHLQVLFSVMPSSEDKAETGSQNAEVAIPILGSGQRILVVDDDLDVARVVSGVLERAGFQVVVVANAIEALNLLTKEMPHAIVLEMMLPDLNGLELARYVRKEQGDRHVPIIALSGASGGFHMNQAMGAGVDIFLNKPVGVDEIIKAVKSLMEWIR